MATLRKEAGSIDLPFDFDELFVTKEVAVVQSIDVKAIKTALEYLVGKVNDIPSGGKKSAREQLAEMAERDEIRRNVDQLMKEKGELVRELEQLKEKVAFQDNALNNLSDTKADKDQLHGGDGADENSPLRTLEDRVAALEAYKEELAATAESRSVADEGGTEGGGEGEAEGGGESEVAVPVNLDTLAARVAELENLRQADKAEIAEMLKNGGGAAADGASEGGTAAEDGGTSGADGSSSAQTDAAAGAAAASAAAQVAVEPPPEDIKVKEDGTMDPMVVADALNRTSKELHELKLQMVAVENMKADINALDEVRKVLGLATSAPPACDTDGQVVHVGVDGQRVNMVAHGGSATNSGGLAGNPGEMLEDLKKRMDEMEVALVMNPVGAAADRPSLGNAKAAVDKVTSLEELLPFVKNIYEVLESKAGGEGLAGLVEKFIELREQMGEKPGKAWVQGLLKHAMSALKNKGVEDGMLHLDMDDVMMGFEDTLGSDPPILVENGSPLADGTAEGLRLQLKTKADKTMVEALQKRMALMDRGGGEGDNSDMFEVVQDMLADRASQYDLEHLQHMVNALAEKAGADAQEMSAAARLKVKATDPAERQDLLKSITLRNMGHEEDAKVGEQGGAGGGDLGLAYERSGFLTNSTSYKGPAGILLQQVGDLSAEIGQMQRAINDLQAKYEDVGQRISKQANIGQEAAQALDAATTLSTDMAMLHDQVDHIAHALNIMSVGPPPEEQPEKQTELKVPEENGGEDGGEGEAGVSAEASAKNVAANEGLWPDMSEAESDGSKMTKAQRMHAVGAGAHHGSYWRLLQNTARGDIRRKSDYFNLDVLTHLVQKVQSLDAAFRALPPKSAAPAFGTDLGMREIESQLRRVIKEVKILRNDKKGDDSATNDHGGWGQRGPAAAEGDTVMLSGKPLLGYKCMACDRPLENLDFKAGPHVPSHAMPNPLKTAVDSATGKGTKANPLPEISHPGQVSGRNRKPARDPHPEVPGKEHGTTEKDDKPAQHLPRDEVGPHLPKGGWRKSPSPTRAPSSRAVGVKEEYSPSGPVPSARNRASIKRRGSPDLVQPSLDPSSWTPQPPSLVLPHIISPKSPKPLTPH